jgi:putative ABC transport system permease protein
MSRVPIALRLATRQWLARPLRPILCSLAIAAAVALIICVGVAMDSLRYTISGAIGQVLGVAEVHVRPGQRGTEARVPQEVLDRVRALPEVDFAGGRLHSFSVLTKGEERFWFDTLGIDPALDERLRPKTYAEGRALSIDPTQAEKEIVVDGAVVEKLGAKLGDVVQYTQNEKTVRQLTIVGILKRPNLEILAKPTLYVSYPSLVKDMGIPPEYVVLDLKLRDSARIEDYDAYCKQLEKKLGPSVDVAPGTSSKAQLTELTRTLRLLLLLLSVMSAFCAALIIGTTLSVGIQERVRQFGQLRCIGASRGQLVLFLLADAAVMLAIGAALGTILGVALSAGLVAYFPNFFARYEVTGVSLAIAFFSGGLATLIGAAIPIWQITRVSPMAAVTAVAKTTRPSRVWLAAGAGLACIALQLGMWYLIPTRDYRFYSYVTLGIPLVFTGWCLLAPAALVLSERVGATLLGTLFAVRPTLLRNAWSRTPWRAGAMIAALMIGVTLFTTVRARGQSLLASWTAPARIPDLIAKKPLRNGFNERALEVFRQRHPEIREYTAFDYFGVRLTDKVFQLGQMFSEGETTFIAVDPKSFSGMVELEYLQGDPATAVKQLAEGGHVFVSKEYYHVRKLGVGDKIRLRGADGNPVEFTIAAVVTSTGVELVQNFFDLRTSFSEKATSSVLGSIGDGKKYFRMGEPTMLLATVTPETQTPAAMQKVRDALTNEGILSFSSVELKTSLRDLIVRIMDGLSVIGVGALCVASLGVANMVIASVHAKRFEFGVLRAIGAGRSQLVRLVLAEVTLIGIVAGVLGSAAGLHFAFMGSQVDFLLIGYPTHFLAAETGRAVLIAVSFTGAAIGLTTLLAWLASLGPAVKGAVSAQRTLLAGGRV